MTEAEMHARHLDPRSDDIHGWFGLTYANYLTLPRSVLQSMPGEWQERFVGLLHELAERYEHLDWPEYTVSARKDGKFIKDPIPHYSRGRTYVEPKCHSQIDDILEGEQAVIDAASDPWGSEDWTTVKERLASERSDEQGGTG